MSAIRQWWHCLINFHRGMDATEQHGFPIGVTKLLWRGCECGRTFFGSKPEWIYKWRESAPVAAPPDAGKAGEK